jgi:Mg-chelatase subunit ChlD
MPIVNSAGLLGGPITLDDYPPTVTRLEHLILNDFAAAPDLIATYGHADNVWEVAGEIEMIFRTPSDNDVRRVELMVATDEAGPWTALDIDPDGGLDVGSDGAPGLLGVDDDGDWNAATDDLGADGLPLTGDAGEGNGVPDVGEPGVDLNDPEVYNAVIAPNVLSDGLDNNDDGYVDDFEYEPPGVDLDRDGLVGEGTPENPALQNNGLDDDGDGIIDDDGVDVNGDGLFGQPDPTVGPGGDSDYNLLGMYIYDNDENGIADMDETMYMAQMVNDNHWNIPDSTQVEPWGTSPTLWSFTLDTKLYQYILNEATYAADGLPEYNDIFVKAVAYDLFGNVVPLYAAPAALRLDNLAPEVVVAMSDMEGNPVNDGDQVADNETYLVGVTSSDAELYNITIDWAAEGDVTFPNNLGTIQDVNETMPWSPAKVGNVPPDNTDDYYFEAYASDILQWWNETTQQWQPYTWDQDGNPATDPVFFGNMEMSVLPTCYPAIVQTCLEAADVAELHVEAVNSTAPLSAITIIEASPTEIRAAGDFADGVRVPAFNAILLFVDNEDVNENGVLDVLNEAALDGVADNADYNKDGVIDPLDIGAFDLNGDGDMVDVINEDANGNGFLDDGIDDGDGQWWTSDIVGCVFEQTPVNENNWVPIETVTGDTVGGVVQDLSYPVAVSWDTRDLAPNGEASYNLRVRSWDVENNWLDEGVEIVTVTVDAQGLNAYFNQDASEVTDPTIDGSTVFGTINLWAFSVDPRVTRVQFRYSDDGGTTWQVHAVDDNPNAGYGGNPTPYRDWATTFDTSLFPDGDYLFDVVGLDEFGNSDEDPTDPGQQIAVTFMNTPPIVAITSPAAGTIVSHLEGNTILELEAELLPTLSMQGTGPIEAQFQYSTDGGGTWSDIDGINSESGPGYLAGDYFADNPRKGARMGAFNRHPIYVAVPGWMSDVVYRKGADNTDMTVVEVGDWRVNALGWTDPMYAAGTWVADGDQDLGTPLTPFVGPVDIDDVVDPAPERFSPFTTTFVTNLVLGNSQMEMQADQVVLLRVEATDVTSGMTAAGPPVEITVRENSDPIVDLIEVTDSNGMLIVESDFNDPETTNQFPGGFTFDDQITIFARAIDNIYLWTDQQGTVTQCQVFYRPRQVDYNFTGTVDWMPGPVDAAYPWIIDMDVSGLNGVYEIGLQVTDEGGNTSGVYPQFSCVFQNMEAVVDGGSLPSEVNEGVTVPLTATHAAGPVDGDLMLQADFLVAPVVLDEPVTPVFQTGGTYAGYYTYEAMDNIVNDVPSVGWPLMSAIDYVTRHGDDIRVDVGGTPGVFHPMGDLMALASPNCYDFAVDYTTNELVFAADPTACGAVTVDYHTASFVQVGTPDDAAPFSAFWVPAFGESGTYDVICRLQGTSGESSATSGIMSRPVALSPDPGENYEPLWAEWNVVTVNDTEAPLFAVGGLGRLATDDPAFYSRWAQTGGGYINLGNALNNLTDGQETMLSGDEVDLAIFQTEEPLDPATVGWTLRDAAGTTVNSGAFTDIGGYDGVPFVHPITFTLYESDLASVVEGDAIENVILWIDFNGDNNYGPFIHEDEKNGEQFLLTDMGDYWQVVVNFSDDLEGNFDYMYRVDTVGNMLDFDLSEVEEPIDDPRNQLPPMAPFDGQGYEIDQIYGFDTPYDSELQTLDERGFWANVDISGLPDGVYFFDFSAADMTGNTATVTKRVIVDRTPFPQDFITVSTGDEVYTGAPLSETRLFANVIDPATPDVNINDALTVTFQWFDGVDWLWVNAGRYFPNYGSDNAVDMTAADGWWVDWTVPNPVTDLRDNDGDGFVDEEDEGQFTGQLRAYVRDLAWNLSFTPPSGERDFTIDAIAPLAQVTLAQVEGDAAPTPAEGKVVTIGEWVDLFAPVPANDTPEAVVFQYNTGPNAGSDPMRPVDLVARAPAVPDQFVGLETPAKGEAMNFEGQPVVLDAGGPDVFGYTWIDSDEVGGPAYNWAEISGVGTTATLNGDDQIQNIDLPFDFPFYGSTYGEVFASTNGWMSLVNPTTLPWGPWTLPTASAPQAVIAPWGGDLDFNGVQRMHYYGDATRFIVQWDDVHTWGGYGSDGPYTFQAILYPDGRIVFQYKEMYVTGGEPYAIGIQNEAQDDGLTVVNTAPYVHNNLAILFAPPGTGGGMWVDIDCTPLDSDDDYVTGMGAVHETPDYTADTDVGGTMYYTCRFDTEVVRHILMGSGDLFAEVRALGIDEVGNEGTAGSTILVMNDMQGPATAIMDILQPGIGWRYVNDPTLAISGTPSVRTAAVGYDSGDLATTTLQWSTTGGDDPSEWVTIGTQVPDGSGRAIFPIDVSTLNGMLYFRAYSTDLDGNIGGDDNANGVIDTAEAGNLHTIGVMVDNDMPAMELMVFGAAGHDGSGLTDGDLITATLLPLETEFVPVLPRTIGVAAWDEGDGSVDVWSCELQFFDDVSDPASPAWVTFADMSYRDTPGDNAPAGAPADGIWTTDFWAVNSVQFTIEGVIGNYVPSREYMFRALVTTYSGMTNHAEEGVILRLDSQDPSIDDIAVGNEEMEGGGGGWDMPPVQVAGGDMVPISAYVIDSWDEWVPGAGTVVDPGNAWESAGMYGVRARVNVAGVWQTAGLMTLDTDANLPGTYTIDWQAPLNAAQGDSAYDVEIVGRDLAGNTYRAVRDDAIVVQDLTPPDGTEIVAISPGPGDGATFPDPTTETTVREEGTMVRGTVTLTAATAANDGSITDGVGSVFFQVMPDGGDWIMIQATADTSAAAPAGIVMTADDQGAHGGAHWQIAWNTTVVDGNGDPIYPDGHYLGRAWAIDDWGNHELLDDVATVDIWVDNTAPVAQMDADPSTGIVETTATVERNDVFTAFARTILSGDMEDTSDDVTVEFMMKLATDMNVSGSWTTLLPGYDATDVNPDSTRPYSFDWWTSQNDPALVVGADYHIAACATDWLGNYNDEVVHHDLGYGLTITIVDTQAPVATIVELWRSMGDTDPIYWPDGQCVRGISGLTAEILRGDTDTKYVRFYYRAAGATEWILADADVHYMGHMRWALQGWDSSGLPEGEYEFMARAEDDAGNVADGPVITLNINRTGPVFAAVTPESDVLPVWEPSLSAAAASYYAVYTPDPISPEGPQPLTNGHVTPTGSYTGSTSRTYTITITGNGDVGAATFDWSGTGDAGSGSGITGAMVELEDGIYVSFCDGAGSPSFQNGDVFTFHTNGKTVDLVVTTDVGMDDIDPDRVWFEYKRSDEPDVDANWMRDAIAPCGVLHDDMLNTWSSKWDISDLESCLYDIRLTMWDVCGNWTTAMVAENVIVDNDCPPVAITNIENADMNDTTLEPIDFGQITDVTRGVPVTIWATATDDEACLPESHETAITQMQFQMSGSGLAGGGMADILFVLDGSGSMDQEIANAQAAMNSFASALESAGVNFALALVDMGGAPDPSNLMLDFTTDVTTFQTAVNSFSASGSQANYDCITGALSGAYGLTWRGGSTRFIILVTDTSPEMGTASTVDFCSTPNPPEEGALIAAVGNQAIVHAIVETDCEDQNAFDGITSATGGALWDLAATNWNPMLASIGNQIAGAVAGGWMDLGVFEVPADAGDDPDVTASQLWDTSGLDEGTYYLRVRAYDEAGNICTSQMVQVNVIDKTPPLARIAGFDPDVLHGDDESTLERVYAMVYCDDEVVDVMFQYSLDNGATWVTFGIGSRVAAGEYDNLEQNNTPEVWASEFNLSDLVALTSVNVNGSFLLRAIAKDSDEWRLDNYGSDRNSPELAVTVVTSPIDGSLALCPGASGRITDVSVGSPRQDNVVVSVTTDAVDEVPRGLVIWEDLMGVDTAAILPMDRMAPVPSSTFQGNVSLSGVMGGGQVSVFATALNGTSINMAAKNMVIHPVDDALGSNGVVGLPRTSACMTAGPLAASVMIPPGNGQSGGLYIGPANLDVPVTPESQAYYIERYGNTYYIELFGGSWFTDGYEALVTIAYDETEELDESTLMPRYWHGDEGWSAEGITHVEVDEVNNEVSFRIDYLSGHSHFSLFLPLSGAPIQVVDYIPWSEGYTDHDPEIKVMLRDVLEGGGIDDNTVEVWIDDRKVANSGTGWALGNGEIELNEVQVGEEWVTEYELIYTHSTIGDPHFQNEKGGDLLDAGMHQLMITFQNESGKLYRLNAAAPLATFGVDTRPVRYAWDPGTGADGESLNFVLGRDPVITVRLWDLESGIHIQDNWVGNQDTNNFRDGIKMDVYRVDTDRYEPGGPSDTYYSRNLIQTATPDMLVFDPPIDIYDPAVHDTLTVSYPMYNVNLDAWNSQELEVVIYTQRTTDYDPDFDEQVNNYDLAVMDLVGNVGSPFVQQRYRIDVCGPTVEFLSPDCGTRVEPDMPLTVTFNLTDECDLCTGDCQDEAVFEGSGVDTSTLSYEFLTPSGEVMEIEDAELEDNRVTFTVPAPLALGEHTIYVYVSDVLGNETRAECHVDVSSDDRLLADAYIYPNPVDPANGGGTFVVNAGQAGAKVSIDVFDFAGNFVATVADGVAITGWGFEIPWDGRAEDGTMLASGPYMARVRVENEDEVMSRTVKVMVWQLDHF